MAVSKVETRGRPFYVAEMPGVSKTSSRIYDDFWDRRLAKWLTGRS